MAHTASAIHPAPRTDWKENTPEGEDARLEALALQMLEHQRKSAEAGRIHRGLHAKSSAGVEARFDVLPDLPEYARVGLFAAKASFPAYVRFSNGSSKRRDDRRADIRGIGIKLCGVPGRKIIAGLEAATTQDFLLIRSRSTSFQNADEFVWFVRAASRPALLLPRALMRFGVGKTLRLLSGIRASLAQAKGAVATSHYFSALPIAFGPYAVRYALEPHAPPEPGAALGRSRDPLGEELATRLAAGEVVYDFRVQFFTDERRTPIEDSSRDWKDEDAPFVTVARLTLPRQDLGSPRGRRLAQYIETLSFDPWHATAELRPLGQMMRARKAAYRLSTKERGAAPEPNGSALIE